LSSQETDTHHHGSFQTRSGATHLTYHPQLVCQPPDPQRPRRFTISLKFPHPGRPPERRPASRSSGRPTLYRLDPVLRTRTRSQVPVPRRSRALCGVPFPLGRREHYVRPGPWSNRGRGPAQALSRKAFEPRPRPATLIASAAAAPKMATTRPTPYRDTGPVRHSREGTTERSCPAARPPSYPPTRHAARAGCHASGPWAPKPSTDDTPVQGGFRAFNKTGHARD
jgi:hypothetical protein